MPLSAFLQPLHLMRSSGSRLYLRRYPIRSPNENRTEVHILWISFRIYAVTRRETASSHTFPGRCFSNKMLLSGAAGNSYNAGAGLRTSRSAWPLRGVYGDYMGISSRCSGTGQEAGNIIWTRISRLERCQMTVLGNERIPMLSILIVQNPDRRKTMNIRW